MEPLSSAESLTPEERRILLDVAFQSIAHGLTQGDHLVVDDAPFTPPLREKRGCFVTLHLGEALRGCVGSLRARGPLVSEVARAAFLAAFRDPRFSPLTERELPDIHIHVSALSTPVVCPVTSESELRERLRPHVDGVILTEGGKVGTFLPEVWKTLPRPADFVRQLKLKAGLSPEHWSDRIRVETYVTESFGRDHIGAN